MTGGERPALKSPARRIIALLVCRLYAVLPCVITPLVMGALCASGHGVLGAAGLVALAFAVMAVGFPDFRENLGGMVVNALFYFTMIALPSALVPESGLVGLVWGLVAGSVLSVAVIAVVPRLPGLRSVIQPELFPDILTGLFLSLAFYLPMRALAGSRAAGSASGPPYDVAVIVCAYEEEATIDDSLRSIREAVARASRSPLVKRVRIVLVDSSPDDSTRRRVASQVDRVIDGDPGKLSARHQAILFEETGDAEGADIVVAADGDRRYDPEWLCKLLAPLADREVVATLGETRNAGAGMSASALCRAVLGLPYNGGNSAFHRSAYLQAPFAIDLDQRRHKALWLEEEFLFGLTLQAQGRVVHVPDCRSYELRPYPLLAQLARHLFGVRLRTF